MYGLGNWAAVGEHVNRNPAECAAHYEHIYLASPAFPEPTPAPEMEGVRHWFHQPRLPAGILKKMPNCTPAECAAHCERI